MQKSSLNEDIKASKKTKNGIYAVASGKGGVGKTWFAITLSHALANLGRKTLLFDGDLGLANVDIQLGLMPKHDLGTVVSGKLPLNQATMPFEEGGFDIIAGRSGTGNLANVSANRLHTLGEDAGGDLVQLPGPSRGPQVLLGQCFGQGH